MAIPLSDEIKALLHRPNFARLATLIADGSPQSVPVWVGREDDHVVICTGEGSLKGKNTLRDPRVALSVVDFRDPSEAQLRGRVVERRPDPDLRYVDPISHKYTGKAFPFRKPEESGARDRGGEGPVYEAAVRTPTARVGTLLSTNSGFFQRAVHECNADYQ